MNLTKLLTNSVRTASEAGKLANRATVGFSTLYNTVNESGFEAHEMNKSIRNDLARHNGYASYDAITDPALKTKIDEDSGLASKHTF